MGWLAYENVEGYSIGERGAWERAAMVACNAIEPYRDAKRHPRPFSPEEFLPWMKDGRPKMTQAAWRAQFNPKMIKRKA